MKQSDQSLYSLHASQNQAADFVKMCCRQHFPLHFLLAFSALTFLHASLFCNSFLPSADFFQN